MWVLVDESTLLDNGDKKTGYQKVVTTGTTTIRGSCGTVENFHELDNVTYS